MNPVIDVPVREQLMQFFPDGYCSDCRCGGEHHIVESDEASFMIRLYCKHHKRCCALLKPENIA